MSKEIDEIREILAYYDANRRAGHTSAMKKGSLNSDCFVLVACEKDKENLSLRKNKDSVISIGQIKNGVLRGYTKPLLIDHAALYKLLSSAVREIDSLTEKTENLSRDDSGYGK